MADNVPEPVFRAFLALDWADKKHAFALEDAVTGQRQSGFLDDTPEAVQAWACELAARFSAAPIAVCLEQSRGPLLSMLLEFENFLVYPVPPQAVAKLRAAFYSSGSKDDPQDAELLLEILQHHRRHLRPLQPDTVEIRQLRLLVADRRDLVDEKTRHKNRLTDRLKQYYPRVLNWFDNLDTSVALDFLERWPTLDQAQQARPSVLRKFFERHGCHNLQRNERRIASIRQAVPLTSDAAVCEPGRARGRLWRRDCWRLLAAAASVSRAPRRCRKRAASRRSGSAAATRTGSMCAGRARSFCGRPFTNLRLFRCGSRCGRELITYKNGRKARTIMPPCARWRSNGFGSCIAAGKTARCMMSRNI